MEPVLRLKKLKLIHANDSKGALNSRIDRYEHIGFGQIGEAGSRVCLQQPALQHLPFILEPPIDVHATIWGIPEAA